MRSTKLLIVGMRRPETRCLNILGMFLAVLGGFGVLFFDGDLDFGGHYKILQTVPYSSDRAAFEIQRTDDQALDGNRYAILIDDHTPTTPEMRHAIISFWRHRSFTLADQSVSIKWAGPNVLTLTTTAAGTSPDWVLNQRHQAGDVTFRYFGRP